MIRKLFLRLFALSWPLVSFCGNEAESVWLGDYTAALEQEKIPVRINAMLDCASSSLPRAKDAERWIISDLPECEANVALARRLMLFWKNHPEKQEVAGAVFSYLRRCRIPDEELRPLLEQSLQKLEWENGSGEATSAALFLLESETLLLVRLGQYDLAEEILTRNQEKKGAPQEALRLNRMLLYLSICQREEFNPPYQRNPASPWEKKKAEYFRFLKTTEDTLGEEDSLLRLLFLLGRRMPGTAEYAKKLKPRFPASAKINRAIILTALELRDVGLLKEYDDSDSPLLLLFAGKYAELETAVGKMPPEEQLLWKMRSFLAQKKWEEAEKIAASFPQESLRDGEIFNDFLRIFQHTGSLPLWEKMKREWVRKKRMLERGQVSLDSLASPANSLAYVALLRNMEFSEAEPLLSFALSIDPNNAAYLDSMAFLRFRQGRFSEAKTLIAEALRQSPGTVSPEEILFHAAQIEWELTKEKEKCRGMLEAALRFAADVPDTELPVEEVKRFQQEIR